MSVKLNKITIPSGRVCELNIQLRIRVVMMLHIGYVDVLLCMYLQGRLNELMSQIRMHTQVPSNSGCDAHYNIDPPLMTDIQQVRT